MTVDTHCHVSDCWYEPVETLLYQMDRCAVDKAWLVQMLGVYDNRYQQGCAARHPDRFVSIVGVDWTRDDALTELERLADAGAIGVRLRPGSRSPGADPLAIWRFAEARNLVVSCVGTATQFAEPGFDTLVTVVPRLAIVLEHLGGLARPDVGDVAAATPDIAALARHPMLGLKLPGLGQLMPRAALGQGVIGSDALGATPLRAMLTAFGTGRLMWGSDFPVVSTREGYANSLNWARAALPAEHHAAIFGTAAMELNMNRSTETKGIVARAVSGTGSFQ